MGLLIDSHGGSTGKRKRSVENGKYKTDQMPYLPYSWQPIWNDLRMK